MRGALALLLLTAAAGAYLIANTLVGPNFVFESFAVERRPISILVDTEPVSGIANPLAVTQELMDAWNAVPQAEAIYATAQFGGPYNGSTARLTFGVFTNFQHEVAFDGDASILASFGIGAGVLGITLKSVDVNGGQPTENPACQTCANDDRKERHPLEVAIAPRQLFFRKGLGQ